MGRVKFIMAGASMRGEYVAKVMLETGEMEIVACADPIMRKAGHLIKANNWQGCQAFATLEEALEKVQCDAVVVASSDSHHAECVLPALAAGKHVFCEKPVEISPEKCRAIIDADKRAGGKTFVGLNLRYAPVYEAAKNAITKGTIGDILTIQADEFYNGGRTYFRRWNRLRSEGGGLWITKATHDFDIINWLAGQKPKEVFAAGARTHYVPKANAARQCRNCGLFIDCPDKVEQPVALAKITEEETGYPWDLCLYNADSDTFDHGMAILNYGPDICATYTCNVVSGFTNRRLRVSGTKGTLDGDLETGTLKLLTRDPSGVKDIDVSGGAGGHGGADSHLGPEFLNFVLGKGEPRCRPAEAADAVMVGLAATRSMDEHRVVKLEEFAF